jgi:hypothetical protein
VDSHCISGNNKVEVKYGDKFAQIFFAFPRATRPEERYVIQREWKRKKEKPDSVSGSVEKIVFKSAILICPNYGDLTTLDWKCWKQSIILEKKNSLIPTYCSISDEILGLKLKLNLTLRLRLRLYEHDKKKKKYLKIRNPRPTTFANLRLDRASVKVGSHSD